MTPDQFTYALAIVESQNNPNSPLGDGGRAAGRWQIHPDFLWTWAHHYGLAPKLGEIWDSFFCRVVQAFYLDHVTSLTPVECAMYFHRGHVVHEGDADWTADDYAQRFTDAAIV